MALKYLTTANNRLALQFGAVLTLLIIGLDPFAQQLMQFRNDFVDERSLSALISFSNGYNMGTATLVSPKPGQQVSADDPTNGYTVKVELPLSMQSAILTGLSRAPEEVEQGVLMKCPTSNCTWDPFNTLGICHRCNDVTANLSRFNSSDATFLHILDATISLERNVQPSTNRSIVLVPGLGSPTNAPTTAYSLPNGHFIANVNGCSLFDDNRECSVADWSLNKYTTTSFGTGDPKKTNKMKDLDTLIWSMSLISPDIGKLNASSVWPDVTLQATECAIYYCAKSVSSERKANRLVENITEIRTVQAPDSWHRIPKDSEKGNFPKFTPPPGDLEFNPLYSLATYSDLVLSDPSAKSVHDNGTYSVNDGSVKSISEYFQGLFLVDYSRGFPVTGVVDALEKLLGKGAVGVNGASFSAPPGQKFEGIVEFYPLALKSLWTWTRNNVDRSFYTLATSMTNEMRRASGLDAARQDAEGTMSWVGSQRTWAVRYKIQWEWMALHGITLLLGVVFFGITLWSSGTGGAELVPLWKSSTLATIRRGYQIGAALEGADTVREMESTARKAYVKVSSRDVEELAACIQGDRASTAGEPDTDRTSVSLDGGERHSQMASPSVRVLESGETGSR